MEISESRRGGTVILGLKGRLETGTSKDLEERLLGLINQGEKQFIIDLAELEYISSSGLRVLILAAKRLKSDGGKIALSSMKGNIKQIFDITGFSSIFPIYPSQEEALGLYQ